MKKFFKFLLVAIFILPTMFIFVGCNDDSLDSYRIKSISQTSYTADSITYTINYEDGSTLDYTVPNNTSVSISSIEKTSSDKNKDIYTITLTNGQTTNFEVRNGVSVEDISYDRTEGQKDYYTVSYSNGTTDEIVVTNGKDGADGVSLEDMYEAVNAEKIANEETPYNNISEFIADYLKFNTSSTSQTVATGKALLSTVSICSRFDKVYSTYSSQYRRYLDVKPFSSGSGVIYKLDKEAGNAYIITNCHVIYDGGDYSREGEGFLNTIYCFLYGMDDNLPYSYEINGDNTDFVYEENEAGEKWVKVNMSKYAIPCSLVGASIKYDVAVLKVENSEVIKASNAMAVEACDSDDMVVGASAIAVGNPNGEGISATSGIISVISEHIQVDIDSSVNSILREFRIDTAVNPGNSGGGLFNNEGKLIGIVNAKTSSTSIENVGYAIPSNSVIFLADNILDNYETTGNSGVRKVLVGVTLGARSSYSRYNAEKQTAEIVEEVMVDSVEEYVDAEKTKKTIANKIGMKVGDVIKSFKINSGEEKSITRTFQLVDLTLKVREGDVITFRVMSTNGEEYYVYTVTADDMIDVK